ncbi:TPA: TipJ family phage tail tip protein [Mannheimia haemolytica]
MGGSSGGSSHTPVEAPESGRSSQRVKIVEVISEGSIGGLVNGLKSVYLDNTPVQNEDGTYNFTNVEAEGRTGTQDQDVMSDFDTTEKEVSVGTEVKKTTPLTRTVIDSNVTRLRLTLGVQSLFKQEDNGDTNGTSVDFKITVGNATYNLNINGKYSSQYLRTIYIENLPQVPFTVRVERLNADSDSQRLQNKTVWASYTEITDTDFAYPNTAYVGIKFNSENFSSIPTRGYEIFGIEVKLPSNYDPETRKYTGLWDGTFKIAWTDNPAWVLMDILLNKRYGLGERLGDFGVDKWALYSIAQYCDQLVPDGYGNMEPRFTCNVWMTEQRSAYDVISDLCSIFRGIPVWNGTEMTFIIDRPADPVWTYTNANVINGEFSRQYSAKKARHNAIQVEYKDKDNAYQSAIEYVSDNDLIRKNGFNLLKVTAFGCTSRGQAYRTGRWILESEKLETETVTFSVGSEGLMHIPGDIIRVTDNHFAGTNLGGRVLSVSGKVVTVDREITLPANSYFSYINAEAKHASIKITKIENGTKLTLETAPAGLKEYDVYSISSQKVTSRLYRCMTITEEDGTYTITALQHEPQKEAIVDNGASFEPVATSLLSGGLQKVSNADVSLSENGVEITFDYAANTTTAVKYQVKLYRNGELYRQLVDVSDTKLTFSNLPDGSYTVEIRAKNERGQLSDPITRTFEINLRIPRFITKSLLFAIELDWDLPKTATVGNYTELWRSPENDVSKAVKVATLPYPQNSHILNGIDLNESYYFFVRCGDKAGNKGQFTEGVFGEADHNPDTLLNVLEGQITRSQLGADLIASLQQDIDTAVAGEARLRQSAVANAVSQIMAESQARAKAIQDEVKARTVALTTEANNRTKAIQAESANLTKKIQAETTARGTAVTQLQNVDAQQAQLISAVTTKADNALSGLEEEKTARANADKAESQAREALTARMGTAEVNIATIQRTVATNAQSISEVSQNLNAKIDNINIGGRNLLRDSEFNLYNKWGNPQIDFTENANRRTIKLIATGTSGPVGICSVNRHCTSYFQQGETYTLSFFARGNRPLDYLYLMRQDGGNAILPVIDIASETEFNYYKLTFKAPFTTQQGYLLVGFRQTSAEQFVEFHSVKLEKGNVATDWTPAPEDVDSAVSAVSADLTSYKQTQAATDSAQAQQLNQLSVNLTKAETNFNAKITEEKKARVDADKVNADKLTDITSRVANAESSISNIQSTKASKTEVASLAQQSLQAVWQADAQAKVDALKVGGRNLIKNSNVRYESNRYSTRYELSTAPQVGDDFVVTLWGNLGETRSGIGVYNSQGFSELTKLVKIRDGVYQGKAAWRKPMRGSLEVTPNDTHLNVYFYPNGDTSTNIIERIKLELGTVATDWTPAPEDADGAINAISSKVDSVQQTLTTANQALGSRIDTVTASVNDAKSQVSQVSKVVSDVSGKLSATSTLKTQVIAGGRKAIAGIALGAESDGVTTESSVIVMADKFGIVANANDGNVKPVFSVVNGQVGIRGDLVVAGSVTRDKFASGGGGNLLQNPIFANLDDGLPYGCAVWTNGMTNVRKSSSNTVGTWSLQSYLPNENLLVVSANGTNGQYLTVSMPSTSIVSEQWYMLSAYMGAHRAQCALMARCHLSTGGYKDFITSYSTPSFNGGIGKSAERKFIKFQAPANTVTVQPIFWLKGVSSENNKILMAARPMLEECTAHTSEPNPWVNSGPAEVHGGSIIANTIRGEHIQANQRITAPIIEGGSLNINNRFKVSNSGQVEMRSNSGNVGMVMNNDAIIVYDEWGNPRVKIGKLS